MLVTVLLLGFVLVATVTDVLWHKIYNWTTYTGILAALGLGVARWWALPTTHFDDAKLNRWIGWLPLRESLMGLAFCGLLMLICFVFFRVGGGDVKLIAMLGAFLGPEKGIEATLWTFVLGGCVGLCVLVWRVGPWQLLVRSLKQILWTLRLRSWSPLTEEEREMLRPPLFLAPSAMAAAVIVRFSLIS